MSKWTAEDVIRARRVLTELLGTHRTVWTLCTRATGAGKSFRCFTATIDHHGYPVIREITGYVAMSINKPTNDHGIRVAGTGTNHAIELTHLVGLALYGHVQDVIQRDMNG